ncbi:hypothetical protein, partial [Streptomyces sp. URMC 123]|uniref:hypothetical protein n=1 Tax=Streptomyces sp. URMC 123 TaxID=3423403 RepID=UPI003F19A884
MNAPYDGDRGRGPGGDPAAQVPPPSPPARDPYVHDAYAHDPYRAQDPAAQDPVSEALYDRAAHPPPPGGHPDRDHQHHRRGDLGDVHLELHRA